MLRCATAAAKRCCGAALAFRCASSAPSSSILVLSTPQPRFLPAPSRPAPLNLRPFASNPYDDDDIGADLDYDEDDDDEREEEKGGGGRRRRSPATSGGKRRINREIEALAVRLVEEDGSHSILSFGEAFARAKDKGLDLVEVNSTSDPPVCRLASRRKMALAEKIRAKDQKKREFLNRKKGVLKEIRVSDRIGENELDFKVKAIEKFLVAGTKCRVTVIIKNFKKEGSKEFARKLGYAIIEKLVCKFIVDVEPRVEGKHLYMILSATSKKMPPKPVYTPLDTAEDGTISKPNRNKGGEDRKKEL